MAMKWFWVNLLFAGVPGWVTDGVTGNWNELALGGGEADRCVEVFEIKGALLASSYVGVLTVPILRWVFPLHAYRGKYFYPYCIFIELTDC